MSCPCSRQCKEGEGNVRREVQFTTYKIDEAALARRELAGDMGAVVSFLGVVRGQEGGQPIAAIDYEIFPEMARHQFELIFDEVEKRWPVASIRLVHRAGRVEAGAPSLWVEVIAPHREEAFAACQFLISEMKRVVPIWKHAGPV
jgi:molybdopterin synthase catalytic subunit